MASLLVKRRGLRSLPALDSSFTLSQHAISPSFHTRRITTFVSLNPSSAFNSTSTSTSTTATSSTPSSTSGIGFACAQAFRKLGARIIVIGRDQRRLGDAVGLLRKSETDVEVGTMEWDDAMVGVAGLSADVSKIGEVEGVVKTVMQKYGPVDYLINSAGLSRTGLLLSTDPAASEELIATNLFGTIHMSRGVARGMLRRKKGELYYQISSVLGLKGIEGGSVYSASKAGVIGFTRSLARELGPKGIRVSAIAPGFIETNMTKGIDASRKESYLSMTPLRRFGQAEEVAQAAVFLAKSQFMTGQTLVLDGGLSC
ncbi:hypothetical protein BC829DRAFT_403792 [Chytridium lagenaria]|nr:hypothetical protein BC829DRAFT_403792 [Chytridium lagenaria]